MIDSVWKHVKGSYMKINVLKVDYKNILLSINNLLGGILKYFLLLVIQIFYKEKLLNNSDIL